MCSVITEISCHCIGLFLKTGECQQAETFRHVSFLMMPPDDPAWIQRSSASYQRVLYAGPMAMTARPSRVAPKTSFALWLALSAH
jgi:hypothetical protein